MPKKKFLTAALMVKDEAHNIGRAIDSIKRMGCIEDILVLDTGSTDDTVAIALDHGARVVIPEDLDSFFVDTETGRHFNFSAGRNRLHTEATGEWLLMLDADEEVEGDASFLPRMLKAMGPEVDALAFMFRDIQQERQKMQFPQPRIFRRWRVRWENIVHNRPVMHEPAILAQDRKSGSAALSILHYGYDAGPETKARKTARTVGLLKKQLEIDPGSWWCYFYLSQIYGDTGELDKCIEASETYIAHKPDVDRFNTSVYFTICQACMLSQNFDLADKWLGEAVKELPEDIDIAAVVFDFGIQTQRPNVVLSGASLYLKAWDKLQENPISMGSRFTYCNHPEALARVLFQIIAMRLEESIMQMERLKTVLPKCTDEEKRATIEKELDATLAKLGVKWTHHEDAGPEQEAA